MKILRYLKIYFLILKIGFMREAAYRTSFLLWALIHILSLATNIVFFSIVYAHIPIVNGWDLNRTLVILGTSHLIIGIGSATYFCFMYGFSDMVRSGNLDFRLSKPIDIQFLVSLREADIEDFINIPSSIILLVIAISRLNISNLLLNILGFSILVISSHIILYSITLMIQSLAFKAVKVGFAEWLTWHIVQLGQYPIRIFKGLAQIIFMLVIPVGLITTIPAEVLMGIFDWKWIVTSLILAISLFIISRKVFLLGLRSYSGASS